MLLLCAFSVTIEIPAVPVPDPIPATATKKKKRSSSKKTKKQSKEESKEGKTVKVATPAVKKRNPVVRGDEVLQLKARKDGDTKLYGYENVGDKYYWWAEAHVLGTGKEQLNLGLEKQWVISPQYTRVSKEFSEGLAAVELNGKVGFIDRNNRFHIPPVYEPTDHLEGFRYGMAAVKKDGKYGFIDKKGEWVIQPTFDDAENFGDDYLAVVKIDKDYGCIDLTGEMVVPCKYIAKEMMKTMPIKNKPYREAKKRAKERWEQGYYTEALQHINAQAEAVNRNISDPNFLEPEGNAAPEGGIRAGDGIYITTSPDGKMGASDSYGRTIFACDNKSVSYDLTQRLLIVERDMVTPEEYSYTGVGIANTGGGWIIPPVFDTVGHFNANGYAPATVGEVSGQVDVFGMVDQPFLQRLLEESVKEKGVRYTRHLIGILPTCAPAHNCLGIYYASECDNLADAIHHFTVAHNLDPDNEDFKANMKAAKSTRNNRRWNRVLTGMNIAATVLTVGMVTYSVAKGTPMQSSSFSSSGYSDSDGSSAYTGGSGTTRKASGSVASGKCPTCQGSGRCSPKSYSARKKACHGSGKCGYCHGTAWIAAGSDRAPCTVCDRGKCSNCGGSGKCPDCHGTGKK